ncbi:PREDICTED: RNA exonuclease 4 isoform X1 [Nicotiana attenuata]|nr:PREDICTED: RNA exonuclease 4 isoform X1 [Nicotiana attenuata]
MEQPYEVPLQTLNITRHKCSACYKQYNKKEHLIEHMKTSNHSVHDPKCGACNKHCKSFESLREHVAGPLSKANCSSIFAERGCTLCLKICGSVDSLNEHKEMCHLTTPRPIDTVEMLNSEYEVDISSGNGSIRSQEAVAIDCEMVGCGSDGSLDYCARVCLVDEEERLIFHTYVQPQLPVTDYRYEITGITEENLRDAMPLNEVRQRILQILYNGESIARARLNGGRANVLVGHNLAHHLDCLVMAYPDRLLRDTATYRPLMKTNFVSHSLKYLTKTYLGYDIQVGFHDPYQDSVSVMRLYKRIRSQDHPMEETTRVPNSSPSFSSISDPWKSMTHEKMTPNYRCWCLDSREAVQRR